MLKEAYDEAKKLLGSERHALDEIADFLITKETITGKEFMEILERVQREDEDAARRPDPVIYLGTDALSETEHTEAVPEQTEEAVASEQPAEETEAVSAQPAETSADSEVTSSETENKQ